MFGKRKSKDAELAASMEIIEANSTQISYLIGVSQGSEIEHLLKEAGIKLKYFSPTVLKPAQALDKKIQKNMGDIKIALLKAKSSGSFGFCEELAKTLLMLIAERKNLAA